jgi:magnesium transporter
MKPMRKFKSMPGTIEYTGNIHKETSIRHIQYNKNEHLLHHELHDLKDDMVDWISVEGLSDTDAITAVCQSFDVEPLVIEDIFHVNQRTKVERFDRYWFIVMKYSYLEDEKILHDYISMLLFPDVLITFSESNNRFIDYVVERLNHPKSIIRTMKHDYLFYVIYDVIVDETLQVSSVIQDHIDLLETQLLHLNQGDQLKLYELRKELVFLRSMASQLISNVPIDSFQDTTFFSAAVQKYYLDVYDHLQVLKNQVIISIEQVSHMLDVYLNQVSNRMNQIMTTLTIFSAIFIPLSFVAGVFGMNFTNFPILQEPYGMTIFILICILIPVGMLLYFKQRKWF